MRLSASFSSRASRHATALLHYLPMSLATKKMQARYERKQRKRDGAQEKREDEEFDLFDRERGFPC